MRLSVICACALFLSAAALPASAEQAIHIHPNAIVVLDGGNRTVYPNDGTVAVVESAGAGGYVAGTDVARMARESAWRPVGLSLSGDVASAARDGAVSVEHYPNATVVRDGDKVTVYPRR